MNTTIMDPEDPSHTSPEAHRQLLMIARRLDRFGLQTEKFLCQQLEQLERAIEELESEKAAWRRQFQREAAQLARQREAIERQCDGDSSDSAGGSSWTRRGLAEADARKSGIAPLHIFLQPGRATSMQVGLLMFELSKLNRDMGGRGIRLEVDEIRVPCRRRFFWTSRQESSQEILELTAYSKLPLDARGRHVALELDATDRLEDWIAFKSRLLQSSLVNPELAAAFSSARTISRDQSSCCPIGEATRSFSELNAKKVERSHYPGAALHPGSAIDCIQQQTVRLENCCEQLFNECGLRVHVELHHAITSSQVLVH